jgi:MYXO-CTERM domain-containing protein
MRHPAITVMVVLVTSVAAWAQNPSNIRMSLRADRTSVAPGETFTATLSIAADVPLLSWNAKFLNPAGFAVTPSYLGVENGWNPFGVPWTNNVLPLTTANGTGVLGSGSLAYPNGAGSGDIFQMVLTVPTAQPLGTVFVTATSVWVMDPDFNDCFPQGTSLPVNIVPEPAGALLLLAGLPLLRRRR